MVSFKNVLSLASIAALANSVDGIPHGGATRPGQCGKVDVFFTGLPAYHPLVISQGFDPAVVASALAQDKAAILAAGYNLKTVLIGPEQPMSVVENEIKGPSWEATGVGFGVRGSKLLNLTAHLEDLIETFRERAPHSFIVFNRSPNSTLEALQRRVPIKGDCSKSPGKDLGTKTICTICGQ